jgi:hypothetical protein
LLTEQITSLNANQRTRLDEYINWLSSAWLNTEANDQEAVEAALASFYGRLGCRPPFVIWCDSPWQLAVAPFLLKLICFQPKESQRRLLRRSYDRGELHKTMRFELARHLNEAMWMRAFDCVSSQVTPDMELAFSHDAAVTAQDSPVSIERAIGVRLEKLMREAHNDMRQKISLQIIEEVMKSTMAISRPATRARITLEQHLGFQVARRFSDFNISIRGGVRNPLCPLVGEFIEQMGRNFSMHVARLLTEDFGEFYVSTARAPAPNPRPRLQEELVNSTISPTDPLSLFAQSLEQQSEIALETGMEARLAQAMTDNALTWANWSQDFFRVYLFPLRVIDEEVYRDSVRDQLEEMATLRMGSFMYVFGDRVAFACKNPLAINLDERSQLHSYTQPALEFLDGYRFYAWQGVAVPENLVLSPEQLTTSLIEDTRNMELRRVLVERYGAAQFLVDSGATLIAQDECGSLFSKAMPGDEALVMVRVRNSTPEPDGTYKDYFLRVPPNMTTPREAVAWTFGLSTDEYAPAVQT